MLHSNIGLGYNHPIHNWEVADAAARLALVVTNADKGKTCFQLDTGTFHILVEDSPMQWETLGSTGEIQTVVLPVKNSTGADIGAGVPVFISGAVGSMALISLADADAEATSSKTIGLTKTLIANNTTGFVVLEGRLNNVDTSAFVAGDLLYLSAGTAGTMTTTRPVAPNHGVFLGYVVDSHASNGIISVHIQNGYELDELHNVLIAAVADGEVLTYEIATGLWKNKVIPSNSTQGKHAIPIMAGAMAPSFTGGCSALTTIASAANQPDIVTLNFDTATQEFAQFAFPMPKKWDEGTISFVAHWSHAATTTNFGVVWGLQAVAVSNDDPIAVAYGTAVNVTDTGGTTDDLYTSPESAAITIGGTPQPEDMVFFRVMRVPADGGDTMAIDARLHGITLYITTNANTDA